MFGKSACLAALLPWIAADDVDIRDEPERIRVNYSNMTVIEAHTVAFDVSVRPKPKPEGFDAFARTVTNPNAIDRVQDGIILRNYADILLEDFLTNENTIAAPTVSDILVHGCWCAKLVPNPFMAHLGGPEPVDVLDEICKNWIKTRNCNDRLSGGSCNIDGSSSQQPLINGEYTLVIDPDTLNNSECKAVGAGSADQCSEDSCNIDLYFMKQIRDYMVSSEGQQWVLNGLTEVTGAGTCADAPDNNAIRVCSGDVPNLNPLQSAEAVFEKAAEQYIEDGWATTGDTEVPVVYKLFNQYMDWYEARDYCTTIHPDASIASVYTADEATLVHSLGAGASAWLGGNDISREGTWVWAVGNDGVNEDSISYSRWWYGEPNNAGNEDCMEKYTTGYWNDIPCNRDKIVICQIRSFV
jgi:hypothetical protein